MEIIDELTYRNYAWNRQVLGLDPALYARHSEDSAAFEERYQREQRI